MILSGLSFAVYALSLLPPTAAAVRRLSALTELDAEFIFRCVLDQRPTPRRRHSDSHYALCSPTLGGVRGPEPGGRPTMMSLQQARVAASTEAAAGTGVAGGTAAPPGPMLSIATGVPLPLLGAPFFAVESQAERRRIEEYRTRSARPSVRPPPLGFPPSPPPLCPVPAVLTQRAARPLQIPALPLGSGGGRQGGGLRGAFAAAALRLVSSSRRRSTAGRGREERDPRQAAQRVGECVPETICAQ